MEGHRYADDADPSWYAGQGRYARPTDPEVSGSHALDNRTAPYDSGVHERPSGAFRLPERRPAGPYAAPDPVTSTGSHARPVSTPVPGYDAPRPSVRGPEYPTIRPTEQAQRSTDPGLRAADPGLRTADPGLRTAESTARPAEPAPRPLDPTMRPLDPTMRPLDPTMPVAPARALDELAPVAQPTSLVPPVTPATAERPRPDAVYQTRRPVTSIVVALVMLVLAVPVLRLLIDATFTGTPSARAVVPAVLLALGCALTGLGLFVVGRGGPVTREAWLRPPVAYLPAGLFLLLAAGLAVA